MIKITKEIYELQEKMMEELVTKEDCKAFTKEITEIVDKLLEGDS